MSLNTRQHLIIAGTSKAGTTSLFTYLSAHPSIVPAKVKETRFFLEPSHALPLLFDNRGGASAYAALFKEDGRGRVCLEATPDYLYSPGAAGRIRSALPGVRVVICLRDPVTRLVSWYRFAKQNGMVTQETTFESYVERQLKCSSTEGLPPYLRSLEHGRYYRYLTEYLHIFGKGRVHISLFERLRAEPSRIVAGICQFVEIDPSFFDEYEFSVRNRTLGSKSSWLHRVYRRAALGTRRIAVRNDRVMAFRRSVRDWVYPRYQRMNLVEAEQVHVDCVILGRLRDYYAEDMAQVADLLGMALPWESASPACRRSSTAEG